MSYSSLKFFILFICIGMIACNNTPGDDDPKSDPKDGSCDNSSLSNYHQLVRGENTREYILHIPASYDENTTTPVVINYHGFGDCMSSYFEYVGNELGLNALADAENFIVVYPQAVLREKGDVYWEPGDNGVQDINDNDSHFTRELISEIDLDYNIDLSRIYATGYSNGGMMSYGLACVTDNMIAAIGIMSGTMIEESCGTNSFTSVIHFHGVEDGVLPYEGNTDYRPISEVIDFWVALNNIPDNGLNSTELNGEDITLDEYTGGTENSSVALYTIHKEFGSAAGHVWFSEDINGQTPNQILWDFLSKHSL